LTLDDGNENDSFNNVSHSPPEANDDVVNNVDNGILSAPETNNSQSGPTMAYVSYGAEPLSNPLSIMLERQNFVIMNICYEYSIIKSSKARSLDQRPHPMIRLSLSQC